MITVKCPNCSKQYSLSSEKIKNHSKVKLNCKSCDNSFVLNVAEALSKQEAEESPSGDLIDDPGDATMIGVKFTKGGDTSSYFFPKDCNILLKYKIDGSETMKVIDKRLTVFGRSEGDIIINDPLISRKHASLEVKTSTMVELRDLASKNGTFHNEMRINSVYLKSGDLIKIGSTVINFSNEIKF